jgi:hypothetical protein
MAGTGAPRRCPTILEEGKRRTVYDTFKALSEKRPIGKFRRTGRSSEFLANPAGTEPGRYILSDRPWSLLTRLRDRFVGRFDGRIDGGQVFLRPGP